MDGSPAKAAYRALEYKRLADWLEHQWPEPADWLEHQWPEPDQ